MPQRTETIVEAMTDTFTTIAESVRAERDKIFTQLSEITAFNSVHNEPGTEADCLAAATWVEHALAAAGLATETFDTADGSRLVRGTLTVAESAPTVLLYSHYDIVPVGDVDAWDADPWTLTERDGRWYARGAADCKGNLVMHLAALRAARAAGGARVNIIAIVEGSEERGGEGLEQLIRTRPELFTADVICIADTGNAAVGVPTLTTSLRGGAQVTVSVSTLRTQVHSGSFGGAAPDAVAALIRILDSLRDDHGRTTIDGVDSSATWPGSTYDADTFRTDAGVLPGVELMGTDADSPSDLVWARPAVTVTGFSSTPVAEAVNAVPATASAQLNLRVPHPLDSAEVTDKLVAHLEAHTPWGAQVDITVADVNPPFSTDTDTAAAATLSECLAQAYGADSTTHVGAGGSIPLAAGLQTAVPEASIVLYGVEEPASTIHSPNESVDPTEIENIAIAEALFLTTYQE